MDADEGMHAWNAHHSRVAEKEDEPAAQWRNSVR